jgi:hypothetical protein
MRAPVEHLTAFRRCEQQWWQGRGLLQMVLLSLLQPVAQAATPALYLRPTLTLLF